MPTTYVAGYQLADALKDEQFELPKNCGDIELEMPVDGAMCLRYRVFLEGEDLAKLGRALARLGEKT